MSLGWSGFGRRFGRGAGLRFHGCGTENFDLLFWDRRFLALGQRLRLLRFDGFAARFGKTPLETLDAPGRVDELLPSRKERVTVGTNL
jgi:hypothetical protein